MNKNISILLFIIFLTFSIALHILLILKEKNNNTKLLALINKIPNIILYFTLFAIVSYNILVYSRVQIFSRLDKLGKEIEPILINYNIENGRYPTNINELNNFQFYKNKIFRILFPYHINLTLDINTDEEGINYSFYSNGIDFDNDKFQKYYKIDYLLSFLPYLDGDILISKGKLKY